MNRTLTALFLAGSLAALPAVAAQSSSQMQMSKSQMKQMHVVKTAKHKKVKKSSTKLVKNHRKTHKKTSY